MQILDLEAAVEAGLRLEVCFPLWLAWVAGRSALLMSGVVTRLQICRLKVWIPQKMEDVEQAGPGCDGDYVW